MVNRGLSVAFSGEFVAFWSCDWGGREGERKGDWEREAIHIAALGKDQNSRFKVRFELSVYCFPTIINLKKSQLNPCKLGIQMWRKPNYSMILSNYYRGKRCSSFVCFYLYFVTTVSWYHFIEEDYDRKVLSVNLMVVTKQKYIVGKPNAVSRE